jgi:hypothetical protein
MDKFFAYEKTHCRMGGRGRTCIAIRLLEYEWNKHGLHTQFDQHDGTTHGACSLHPGSQDAAHRDA